MKTLSFFSEIRKPQRGGGLIFTLGAHGGDDKHNDGDNIGRHLVDFLDGKVGAGGDVYIENIQSAK